MVRFPRLNALFPLAVVRERRPLVHNITNYVVMNETANAIRAGKGLFGEPKYLAAFDYQAPNFYKKLGFEIRDNLNVSNGSGIRLTAANSFIEIRNNRITNMMGHNAMGITVYGTEPTRGISNLVIDGNEIFKCQPALSEALVLNGNVHDFVVSNNYIHHVNNIGMDFIGGEGRSPDPATDMARNGLVVAEPVHVHHARPAAGGGRARPDAGRWARGAAESA